MASPTRVNYLNTYRLSDSLSHAPYTDCRVRGSRARYPSQVRSGTDAAVRTGRRRTSRKYSDCWRRSDSTSSCCPDNLAMAIKLYVFFCQNGYEHTECISLLRLNKHKSNIDEFPHNLRFYSNGVTQIAIQRLEVCDVTAVYLSPRQRQHNGHTDLTSERVQRDRLEN